MSGGRFVRYGRRTASRVLVILLVATLVHVSLVETGQAKERTGRLEVRLVREDGSGVAGATIVLNETGATGVTGTNGKVAFSKLPAATYSVTLTVGQHSLTISSVQVVAGTTKTVEKTVDWVPEFTYSIMVQAPSRLMEPLMEAPAATTTISEMDIDRKAPDAEVAKLIEFTPGAQLTRGGLWDFNLGTRGFNRALSRRVAVQLDGRDLSLPFFGYQGWPAFSFPLDDLSSVEFVRGPNAALYGANATGGVISMTSKEPRFSRGGMLRVALGALDTVNVEGRWAGSLGGGWYARAAGGFRRSNGFAVQRVDGPEYSVACPPGTFGDCLPTEVVRFDGEDAKITFGQIRFDKYFDNSRLLTLEGGDAVGAFGVFQTAGQRAKSVGTDGKRPWVRGKLSGDSFHVAATYDRYSEPSGYIGLSTGEPFNSNSSRLQLDGQMERRFNRDRIQLMAGAIGTIEKMDSYNQAVGGQTFLFRPIRSDAEALFTEASWTVANSVKLQVAARGDWSSLYDFQFSPRASVTFAVTPTQSLRLTYNRGFQVSNSLEYFLKAAVAPPTDLTALNGFCAPFGVDCRFGPTSVLALGNEDLKVETVHTVEAGYKGVVGDRLLVTIDYFRTRSSNLVTSLLPQIGTALGRLNPRFGPWKEPAGLPDVIADQIRTLVPFLSNDYDGSNILAVASYTNFDKTRTQGLDVGMSGLLPGGWRPSVSYSWFSFDVPDGQPDTQGLLLPNTPSHAVSGGVAYENRRFDASADVRWVDGFRWSDGFFLGNVESYSTVDVAGAYPLSPHVSVILNVTNVFNDRHWETFGGALLRRRGLVSLQYRW